MTPEVTSQVAFSFVVSGDYRDLFIAVAGCAATLIGLLFVAISVAPHREATSHFGVVHEVRASAALLAFTSALSVAMFGLVPGNNVGYPASVVGVIGIMFTAASVRSILASTASVRLISQQLGLIVVLLLIFGTELTAGIVLLANRDSMSALDVISNVLAASLLVGVARAWELVGNRDTGLANSIAILSGHARSNPDRNDDAGADPIATDPAIGAA